MLGSRTGAQSQNHAVFYELNGLRGGGMFEGVEVRRAHACANRAAVDALKAFLKSVQSSKPQLVDIADLDVLMLRNDPSNDAIDRPWAETIGIQFGRRAAQQGVLVLNDPDSLSRAINKLYFQEFPREVRAETLITRFPADVKEFAQKHGGKIVLKPLQGSGGTGVFLLTAKESQNLTQIIETIAKDGYVVAQEFLPAAKDGDVRMFLMNGEPSARRSVFHPPLLQASLSVATS